MNYKIAWVLISSILFYACNSTKEDTESIASSRMLLNLNYEGTPASNELTNASAFLYKENAFVAKTTQITPDQDGYYVVENKNETPDKLLFFAGDYPEKINEGALSYTAIQEEKSATADFITTFPQFFYTGERALGKFNNAMIELNLLCSVARLDITKTTQLDVVIDSCVITNLATQSYLLPNNSTPIEDLEYKKLSLGADTFTDFNTKGSIEGVTYLYESTKITPTITLYVVINGVRNILVASFPKKIERNKRYEVEINSNGAYYKADIQTLPWGEGTSVETDPKDFVPKIDLANSNFPEGVWTSAENDTLYVGADFEGNFILALEAPTETEIKFESAQFQVKPVSASRSSYTGNQFEISASMNELNRPTTITHLYIKKKTEPLFYNRHLVLVREGFRTRIDGYTGPSSGNKMAYTKYIDGELGKVNSSFPIAEVSTYSTDSQFNWLRVQEREEEEGYLLEGGFKPNDTEANGQNQVSVLKVKYADNFEEEFTFTRKRYSIPVITQGGLYWAKYNMRGNSKSYEDQIGFDRDMPRNELYTYLQTCSDEDFIYYTGASYRGTSTEGIYLKRFLNSEDEPTLLYDGYDAIPNGVVSSGPADAHCPPGYRMPKLSELQLILFTNWELNIPSHGTTNSYNTSVTSLAGGSVNRYTFYRHTREVTIDGVTQNVSFLKIRDIRHYSGEEMVFLGFGAQTSSTNISWGETVIPISTSGGDWHYSINYKNNKTNYVNLSGIGVQTRVIRCIKSPTNFIVE